MHTMRSENNFWYKCKQPNCQSTFKDQSLLDHHMRIHNNELFKCQYCPYRYAKPGHYGDHLNKVSFLTGEISARVFQKCKQITKGVKSR